MAGGRWQLQRLADRKQALSGGSCGLCHRDPTEPLKTHPWISPASQEVHSPVRSCRAMAIGAQAQTTNPTLSSPVSPQLQVARQKQPIPPMPLPFSYPNVGSIPWARRRRKGLRKKLADLQTQVGQVRKALEEATAKAEWVQVRLLKRVLGQKLQCQQQLERSERVSSGSVAARVQQLSEALGLSLEAGLRLAERCDRLVLRQPAKMRERVDKLAAAVACTYEDALKLVLIRPSLLLYSPNTIMRNLEQLTRQLGVARGPQLVEVLSQRPELITANPDSIAGKVSELASLLGVSESRSRWVIVNCPRLLRSSAPALHSKFKRMRRLLAIPGSTLAELLVREPSLLVMTSEAVGRKFQALLFKFAMFEDEVVDMLLADPSVLLSNDLDPYEAAVAAAGLDDPLSSPFSSSPVSPSWTTEEGGRDAFWTSRERHKNASWIGRKREGDASWTNGEAQRDAFWTGGERERDAFWTSRERQRDTFRTTGRSQRFPLDQQCPSQDSGLPRLGLPSATNSNLNVQSPSVTGSKVSAANAKTPAKKSTLVDPIMMLCQVLGVPATQGVLLLAAHGQVLEGRSAGRLRAEVTQLATMLGVGYEDAAAMVCSQPGLLTWSVAQQPTPLTSASTSASQTEEFSSGTGAKPAPGSEGTLLLAASVPAGDLQQTLTQLSDLLDTDEGSLRRLFKQAPSLLTEPRSVIASRLKQLQVALGVSGGKTTEVAIRVPQLLQDASLRASDRLAVLQSILGISESQVSELLCREPELLLITPAEMRQRYQALAARFGLFQDDAIGVVMADPSSLLRLTTPDF